MENDLILTPVPALVAVLLAKEKEKDGTLTKDEVEKIRDQAECIAMPLGVRKEVDDSRGYLDINPEHVWDEWQTVRTGLVNG
jgi:hypothetical protein